MRPRAFLWVLPVGLFLASCTSPPPPPVATPAPAPAPAVAPPPAAAGALPPAALDTERWTGLVVEPVTEALAGARQLTRVEGLYVSYVEAGSPGQHADVRAGDVVLLAGGSYVGDADALDRALAEAPVGSTVTLALRRTGQLVTAELPVATSPAGRLMLIIQPPGPGLVDIAADGTVLYGYGRVPGGEDRGIVPLQLPGGPLPPIGPRAVASPGAERVIAADGERVYLGWAGSEIYLDYYEIRSGRVGRLPVRGAESLKDRCHPQGLTRVGRELWMACRRPDGPAVVRIDIASGDSRVEPLPATYVSGLAFDGEAVWWLCCPTGDQLSVSRTAVASGAGKVFPLPERALGLAADGRAVYVLGPNAIFQHKPWR